MTAYKLLLLSAAWLLNLSIAIAASTPRWDADANKSACRTRLSNVGVTSSPDTLMNKVSYETKTTVKLPYAMTQAYASQFLPLEFNSRDAVNFETYLAYAKGVEVIPTYGHVESWHNLVKVLDGYYISLHFKSATERKTFVEKIRYFVQVYEGEVAAGKETRYPVALTLDQYEILQVAYPDLFGIKLHDKIPTNDPVEIKVEASSENELRSMADNIFQSARGSATYYFKGKTSVGFRNKEGLFFKIGIYRGGKHEDAIFASHSEILRRQREALKLVSDMASMSNPRIQLSVSRKLLDQSIAQLKVAAPSPWTGPVRIDVEGQTQVLVSALEAKPVDAGNVQRSATELAYHRYNDVISRIRDPRTRDTILALPDIRKIERGMKDFFKGEANTKKRLKIFGIQSENLADSIYFVHGDIIHDNMARLLLGDHADDKTVQKFTFGAHIELSYDDAGKLKHVKVISHAMRLLTGSKQMTNEQGEALGAVFEDSIRQAHQ